MTGKMGNAMKLMGLKSCFQVSNYLCVMVVLVPVMMVVVMAR